MEKYADPSQQPSMSVKQAIAALEECEPDQLGTLNAAVDIDELIWVLDPPSERGKSQESIVFRYCGYSVEVASDRRIRIEP